MSIDSALKDPVTDEVTVPAHQFGGGLHLWAEGKITRQEFIDGVGIPADAHADIDAMAAVYTAKASAILKLSYVVLAERCAVLLQTDAITHANFRTFMEI